jgi:hypothetical protein
MRIDRKLRKRIGIFREKLVGDCKIARSQGIWKKS